MTDTKEQIRKLSLEWFAARFPQHGTEPFPYAVKNGATYVMSPMSEIEGLREAVKKAGLPSPVIPVILMDTVIGEQPRGRWLRVDCSGLFWEDGPSGKGGRPIEIAEVGFPAEYEASLRLCPLLTDENEWARRAARGALKRDEISERIITNLNTR